MKHIFALDSIFSQYDGLDKDWSRLILANHHYDFLLKEVEKYGNRIRPPISRIFYPMTFVRPRDIKVIIVSDGVLDCPILGNGLQYQLPTTLLISPTNTPEGRGVHHFDWAVREYFGCDSGTETLQDKMILAGALFVNAVPIREIGAADININLIAFSADLIGRLASVVGCPVITLGQLALEAAKELIPFGYVFPGPNPYTQQEDDSVVEKIVDVFKAVDLKRILQWVD